MSALKLSPNMKKLVDFALAVVGAGIALAVQQSYISAVVGLAAGYAVSDVLTYVDTGALPSIATVATQAETATKQGGA